MSDNIKKVLEYILESEQTHYEEDPSENHIFRIAQKAMEKFNKKNSTDINRVIMVCIDYDDLQAISWELNTSDYWADLGEVSESELMQGLITPVQFETLKNGEADYIVFREDN